MEKTPRYQLSQWEKTDRILMEDFNADNANLEAALASLAADTARLSSAKADLTALNSAKSALQTEDARLNSVKLEFVTLMDETFSANGETYIKLPVDGPAIGQLAIVNLEIYPRHSTTYYMSANSNLNGTFWEVRDGVNPNIGIAKLSSTPSHFILFPMKNLDAYVTVYRTTLVPSIGYLNVKYKDLQFFTLRTNDVKIMEDVRVRITGIR